MPIPTAITDLSETASSNSPQGSDTVGTQANEYIQALSAFIRQIYDTVVIPTASFNLNGQKLTNIAQGTISTTSTDAVRGDQLYKIGEIRHWNGAAANIATVWGAGWQIADGTNGTHYGMNRIPIGAGGTYTVGVTGGATTAALATTNMPAHSHTISDPGHTHGISDPGHNHVLYRDTVSGTSGTSINSNQGISNQGATTTTASATNIGINPATTGITGTGSVGSGTAFSIMPPYVGVLIIEYVGA